MSHVGKLFLAGGIVALLSLTGCAEPQEQVEVSYQPTGTVHNFMMWHLEPAADVLWDSAGFILTAEGEQDLHKPQRGKSLNLLLRITPAISRTAQQIVLDFQVCARTKLCS